MHPIQMVDLKRQYHKIKAEVDEAILSVLESTAFINGKPVQAYVGWVMTHGFNLVSQCPVMSVPTGFASTNIPTGMQIVARPYDDLRVFRAAAAFEAVRPWRGRRPSI